ncbi:MAG TPA: hypothetical protein VFA75_17255 [Nevskia sp.]|jgi:hypothetical protein|nr:hypothetical protein [Nevskia sp.]
MARTAVLAGSIVLCGCGAEAPRWMNHATLVLRPSHKQALLAYSFGAEAPREEAALDAGRSVAASVAAGMVVRDNPLPDIDTVDFKGGRFYIHTPRTR